MMWFGASFVPQEVMGFMGFSNKGARRAECLYQRKHRDPVSSPVLLWR